MYKLLLKVEETFSITGRGVILAPEIPLEHELPQSPTIVTLKHPDGSTRTVEAAFHIPHIKFANIEDTIKHLKRQQTYTCMLKGIEKAEVPIGTEIWLNSD